MKHKPFHQKNLRNSQLTLLVYCLHEECRFHSLAIIENENLRSFDEKNSQTDFKMLIPEKRR